jgi:hypothetical protein
MISPMWSLKWIALGVLALAALSFQPATAEAASIGFRNDTDSPLMLQGMSIVNGVVRRGKLHVLQPGDVAWDPIIAPGNKLVVIADPSQPTRTLCQETIVCGVTDAFYSIQPDSPNPPKPRQPKGPPSKVKLVRLDKFPMPGGSSPPPRRP